MRFFISVGIAVVTMVCGPAAPKAFAWGDEGHRAVATIAYRLLPPAVKARVDAMLAGDPMPVACGSGSFVGDAVWPDRLREKPRVCASGIEWGKTASWHFLDIPVDASRYDPVRDCPRGDCVVAKIEEFRKVLADQSAPMARRRDALKFLIHFVGDLHQPLHTTSAPFDRANGEQAARMGARRPNACLLENLPTDRGGNCVDVRDGRGVTELHAFWDRDVVRAISGNPGDVAANVMKGATRPEIAAIQSGTVIDWTNESHRVAVDVVYGDLPPGPMPQLDGAYLAKAVPAVRLQLRRAGIRLAKVIEEALE